MIALCQICDERILHGELVGLYMFGPFHELKSQVHFALGQPVGADNETLCHKHCYESDKEYRGQPGYREV
jgi:hypothetical protein